MKTIVNQTGGRLGNQLYYILHIFLLNKKSTEKIMYTQTDRVMSMQTDMLELIDKLHLQDYVTSNNSHVDYRMPINEYYQGVNIHFTEKQLIEFCNQTLIQSPLLNDKLKEIKNLDNTVSIHIRNGDFLTIPNTQCFNKRNYLNECFLQLPQNITDVVIYSDNNDYNIQHFNDIISSRFKNVTYRTNTTVIDDFIELCCYKYKILWNSTFSFWSAYISNILYNNKNNIFVPSSNEIQDHEKSFLYGWNIIRT